MPRITTEEMQSWVRDRDGIQAKFGGNFKKYRHFCENPFVYEPPPPPPKAKRLNSMEELAAIVELEKLKATPRPQPRPISSLTEAERESHWRNEFNSSAQLKSEFFGGVESYVAYKKREFK